MTRFWDRQTDGQTDGRSDCTPRPAFAFGDAGKNWQFSSIKKTKSPILCLLYGNLSHFLKN